MSEKMISLDEVLMMLNVSITTENTCLPNIEEIVNTEDDFFMKIGKRVQYFRQKLKREGKTLPFEQIYHRKLEVGDMTGKQVLKLLLVITNKPNLMKNGNCFVFFVDGKPDTALTVLISNRCIELRSYVEKPYSRSGMWAKAFDDKILEYQQNDSRFLNVDKEFVENLRKNLPENYEKFMKLKLNEIDEDYRHLFAGVLKEIAKSYIIMFRVHNFVKNFPTSALIKLAIDHGLSGKLQAVFNDHKLGHDVPNLTDDPEQNLDLYYEQKAKLRKEGAKYIIDAVFTSVDGKYKEGEVKKIAKEIMEFYA